MQIYDTPCEKRNLLRKLKSEIWKRKHCRYDYWCRDSIVQSPHPNWIYVKLERGNIIATLPSDFVQSAGKKLKVVEIDGKPFTIRKISKGLYGSLIKTRNFRTFYHLLTKFIPNEVLKRCHYPLWRTHENLENLIKELQAVESMGTGK